jgi:predicted RNA-binding Zn ribbon-like protein
METQLESQQVRELPIVAGHLALDFANTVDDPEGRARHDHIGSYPDLLRWSVRAGALSAAQAGRLRSVGARDAASALRRAHALRETIGATFADVAAAAERWPDLRPYVIDALAHSELTPAAGSYAVGWAGAGEPHAMLWPVAHAAAGLLTAGELHRVKRCAGCPWLFLDQSKNGSRRWCAMNDCGTHAKITRYVARRAARRAGQASGPATPKTL